MGGWRNSEQTHSPVSTLLVSEGHRSRARIPGTLALCRPWEQRETDVYDWRRTVKTEKSGRYSCSRALLRTNTRRGGHNSVLTAWEATWRYLLRSSDLTSSSGTVLPLWKQEKTKCLFETIRVHTHTHTTLGCIVDIRCMVTFFLSVVRTVALSWS